MTPKAERWSIASALAFSILYVAGFITLFSGLPNYDSSKDSLDQINQAVTDAYDDPAKRTAAIVGAYLVIVAALVLLWFVAGLRARMRRLGTDPIVGDLAFAAGVLAAALLSAGAMAAASIAGNLSIGNEPKFSNDVMRAIPELAYPLILIGGMLALAVVIGAMALTAPRSGLLPKWVAYLGWLAFVAAVFAILFVPQIVVMIWFLIVGIVAAIGKLPEKASTAETSSA